MGKTENDVARMRGAVLDAYRANFDGIAARLESPLEVALYWALLDASREWGIPLASDNAEWGAESWVSLPTEQGEACVFPQHEVTVEGRKYRLDFFAQVELPHLSERRAALRFDIECDGHDFHERTKEQAARDRRRDRDLQRIGYIVLRYTGSEIFRDPPAVAKEILSTLSHHAGRAFAEDHDAWMARQGKA